MNQNNRIVDIKALLCRILYLWRPILALTIILALFGGGKEFFTLRAAVANNKETEQKKSTNNENEPDYSFSEELALIDKQIAERQDFLRNAPAWDINPYNTSLATHSFYITQEFHEDEETVVATSSSEATDGEVYDAALEFMENSIFYKVDWKKIGEQIGVEAYEYLNQSVKIKKFGDLYHITVAYNNPEDAKVILDETVSVVKSEFAAKQDVLHYSITDVDEYQGKGIYKDRFGTFLLNITNINNLMLQRNNLLNNADIIGKSGSRSSSNNGPTSISKKSILKSAIKFGIVGVVLAVGLAFIKLLLGSKVLSSNELYDNYQAQKLLAAPIQSKQNGVIDQMISSLFNGSRVLSKEESIKIAGQEVNHFVPSGEVTITGDVDSIVLNTVKEELENNTTGVNYTVCANPLISSVDREVLTNSKNVIVVTKQEVSSYNVLNELMELIRSRDIHLIGTICE